MVAAYTYDPGLVFDDTTLTPSVNATGQLLNVAGGTVQQVYDLNGTPMATLTTNQYGYVKRFRADVAFGVISFGSVLQPVVSVEALQSGPNAAAAATSAAAAAASASASSSSASSAAAAAAQAAADVQAYIASGGSGGGGGLPAGTTLDAIPDGTSRLAYPAADRDKLALLDGTSDMSKPVSTLQAQAIALKANFIGSTKFVRKDPTTGFWPASYLADGTPVYTGGSASAAVRPTASLLCCVFWIGADPSPGSVASGTGGMMQGVDQRIITT